MTRLRVHCPTLVLSTKRILIDVLSFRKKIWSNREMSNPGNEEQEMKILSLYASVIALSMVSMLYSGRHHNSSAANDNAAQITDGAFRDGLYLGRLAAEGGSEPHVAIGRWATAEDRSSFAAGYQRGYNELLASRAELDNRVRQTK
jgi:hypothetical protein